MNFRTYTGVASKSAVAECITLLSCFHPPFLRIGRSICCRPLDNLQMVLRVVELTAHSVQEVLQVTGAVQRDMASSLEDLFAQIIQSEERAQERKNVLQEVKAEIQQYQESIRKAEHEKEDFRQHLANKVQEENDTDLKLKWMITREKIMKDQADGLKIQKSKIDSEIKSLMEHVCSERERFCRSVEVFSKGFGLTSNGPAVRLACKQEEITALQKDKQHLEKDLGQYKAKQEQIKELGLEKAEALALLDKAITIENGVLSQAEMEEQTLDKLEKEKVRVSEMPLTGAEFKRSQAELEQARQESRESLCEKMQQQYQQLQQQLWQNEVNTQSGKRAFHYVRGNGIPLRELTDSTATRHNSENMTQAPSPGYHTRSSNCFTAANYNRSSIQNDAETEGNAIQ